MIALLCLTFYTGKGPSLGPLGLWAQTPCRDPKGPSKAVITTWALLATWALWALPLYGFQNKKKQSFCVQIFAYYLRNSQLCFVYTSFLCLYCRILVRYTRTAFHACRIHHSRCKNGLHWIPEVFVIFQKQQFPVTQMPANLDVSSEVLPGYEFQFLNY